MCECWSSYLSGSRETLAVALVLSKDLDGVWQKPSILILPVFGFYSFLCTVISNFLSARSVAVIVRGYCSSHKTINTSAP